MRRYFRPNKNNACLQLTFPRAFILTSCLRNGGTAILYRKSLSEHIKVIDSDESHISGIQVNTDTGPMVLLNVYMSTNYADDASLELQCAAKKVSPKVICHFLSNHLEFLCEILQVCYLFTYT